MTSPATDQTAARGASPGLVRAAGAVCWRLDDAGLQVLLVHRPKYDDWSWPKGKLDDDEPVAAAGVREVEEETGLRVQLGVPLPAARYRLGEHVDKHVAYWAARVSEPSLPPPPRPHEVDRAEWVTPDDAHERLTRRGDRVQLHALVDAYDEGRLETFPLVVVRHAHALEKERWDGEDADRPLVDAGHQQARQLAAVLEAWRPETVVTSPWERCAASVAPFAETHGIDPIRTERLTEDGHRRDPATVSALVTDLLRDERATAVCTHRPVLGTLLGTLAGHCSPGVADGIPRSDPFLEPGEALVAHVSRRSGRVVAVERHPTP